MMIEIAGNEKVNEVLNNIIHIPEEREREVVRMKGYLETEIVRFHSINFSQSLLI